MKCLTGGEGGIRTLGTRKRTHTFQACSFSHSDTSPFFVSVTGGRGVLYTNHLNLATMIVTAAESHYQADYGNPVLLCPGKLALMNFPVSRSLPVLAGQHQLLMNITSSNTRHTASLATAVSNFDGTRDRLLESHNRRIWHLKYECDLYTWLSRGKVKTAKTTSFDCYFLYIEYRDRSGASRYVELYFDDLESCLAFRGDRAESVALPGINPAKTRKRPIMTCPD